MAWQRQLVDGDLREQLDQDQRDIEAALRRVPLKDGGALDVFDVGEGEPIVCMPMLPEMLFVYAAQIEEFSRDHRVIQHVPRLSRERVVHIADRAREVVALLDALGLERAHLLAWSDTGSSAYYLARHWPERVRSLAFLGMGDFYRFPFPVQFMLVNVLGRLPVERLFPQRMVAWFLAQALAGPVVKPAWVLERIEPTPQITHYYKYSIQPNWYEHRPAPGEVTTPAIVICGDRDSFTTPEQARRFARLMPNAGETVIIPGAEHFIAYVNRVPVNRELRRFYQALASGDGRAGQASQTQAAASAAS